MTLSRFIAAATLVALPTLGACSGGAQTQAGAPMAALPAAPQTPADRNGGCPNDNGVQVTPCRIAFDGQHTADVNVMVRTGHDDRDRIRERDDCAARGIATIVQMSNHKYTVSRGATMGRCTASFDDDRHGEHGRDDGPHRGDADLEIRNSA